MKKWLLHPLLLGVYPVVSLLGHNIDEMRPLGALRAFALAFIASMLLWAAARLVTQDWGRAALLASSALLVLYVYQAIYREFSLEPGAAQWGRHRFLLPVFGAVLAGAWWGIRKKLTDPGGLQRIFSAIALAALALPVYQLGAQAVGALASTADAEVPQVSQVTLGYLPDIYLIVLDAYARSDVLEEVYGFENGPFLTELERLGFYVAACSQSNYSKTRHSIASTLNFNYLEAIGEGDLARALGDPDLIRNGAIRRFLSGLGYTAVSFPTGFYWSEMDTAEIYLEPETLERQIPGPWQPFEPLTAFESLLLQTHYGLLLDGMRVAGVWSPGTGGLETPGAIETAPRQRSFEQVSFALQALESIPEIPGPKFVYAHIVSPHPPYVFSRDGSFNEVEPPRLQGYVDQLDYLNGRILGIVRTILEESDEPPVILIMGDHGSKLVEWSPQGVQILNAYYLPGAGSDRLYPEISPVNSFRVVLDSYFGTDLGLVEDVSYSSLSEDNLREFEIFPNTCPE